MAEIDSLKIPTRSVSQAQLRRVIIADTVENEIPYLSPSSLKSSMNAIVVALLTSLSVSRQWWFLWPLVRVPCKSLSASLST